MLRSHLVNYQGTILTEDTVKAVQEMAAKAALQNWDVQIVGPVAGSQDGNPLSLVPSGRELHFKLVKAGVTDSQQILNATWGFAVPAGFTPWMRYPVVGHMGDAVYHYLGIWKSLYDRLIAEGRGHLAWPSVCAAAQCDVGCWRGDRANERFLQAQLHRLGHNCGPIDGVIGPRTLAAINALGCSRMSTDELLRYVRDADFTVTLTHARQQGHIAIPGRRLSVNAFGGVKALQTNQGVSLTIDSPGRIILDIGDPI